MQTSKIEHSQHGTAMLFDTEYLESLRQQMVKFVQLQASATHEAEDIVQEALISALKYADRFQGKSAFKTWVFAILKNKMIDFFRKKSHVSTFSELSRLDDDAENQIAQNIEHAFDTKGHWEEGEEPSTWQSPEQVAENEDFWLIFDACLNGLPAKNAKIFMLREILDLTTEEICTQLELSISNFNVIMYRSRMQLRKCLENKWLLGEST